MKSILIILIMILGFKAYSSEMMAHDAYVRLLPPTSKTTAGFMNLMNHGNTDMKLIKVESDIAEKVEIHNHTMVDGMMKMRQVKEIQINKHKMVELKPGGYHIMFIGLKKPLSEGQIIKMKLYFANKLSIDVEAPVKRISSNKTKEHHHH